MQIRPRIQADLDWLVHSPDLISTEHMNRDSPVTIHNGAELLTGLSIETNQIGVHEFKTLGRYFEYLWHEAIDLHPDYSTLYSNLQLIHHKQTLGEFDSILQSRSHRQTTHCELAVKFYLKVGEGSQLSDWIGPNIHDRLDKKYTHLLHKQLQLSHTTEAINYFNNISLLIDNIALLLKGRLFYDYQSFISQQFVHPEQISTSHARGFWSTTSDFDEIITSETDVIWYQLPRMYWLADLSDEDIKNLNIYENTQLKRVCSIVGVKNGREHCRGFIVPAAWLAQATEALPTNR